MLMTTRKVREEKKGTLSIPIINERGQKKGQLTASGLKLYVGRYPTVLPTRRRRKIHVGTRLVGTLRLKLSISLSSKPPIF